jgi:uncharacterized phage protein gp47/JayE
MSAERPFLKKNFADIVDGTLASLREGLGGRVAIADATEGSVVRTLVEVFARELAVCYEQLEAVYRSGYLDTADAASLERVVALLGVERRPAGWLEGEVVFSRRSPAPQDYAIPLGTVVGGRRVPSFETTVAAVLRSGGSSVRVPVRALERGGEAVEPGRITYLIRPLEGIEGVTNQAQLAARSKPETDEELRSRTRGAVKGGRTATLAALEHALRMQGIRELAISEDRERPGRVQVVIGDTDLTPAELEAARAAVEEVRPAGVRLDAFQARTLWIRLRATVILEDLLDPRAEAQVRAELRGMLIDHVEQLGVNQTLRWPKLRNLLLGHPRLAEVATPTTLDRDGKVVPDWPLRVVDRATGEEQRDELGQIQRLLGSPDSPLGVFVGIDERARLHSVDLMVLPPESPVWIDVQGRVSADVGAAQIATALANVLPDEALPSQLTLSWDDLHGNLLLELRTMAGANTQAQLQFVILHSRDGRVITLAPSNEASQTAAFDLRERLEVRNVTITGVL